MVAVKKIEGFGIAPEALGGCDSVNLKHELSYAVFRL